MGGTNFPTGQDNGGRPPMWGSRGPPMPPLAPTSHDSVHHNQHQYHPHQHPYHHGYQHHSPHHQLHQPHQHQHYQQHHGYHGHLQYGRSHGYDGGANGQGRREYNNSQQKRLLLAMAADQDSLSDRQCYVRSEMVEIFAATEKDVSARHSKGAQKLVSAVSIVLIYDQGIVRKGPYVILPLSVGFIKLSLICNAFTLSSVVRFR